MASKKSKKVENTKKSKPITQPEDFLQGEEYGYVVQTHKHPYQQKAAGIDLQPGVVTKVKKDKLAWLKDIIGVKVVKVPKK